jgi:hypothetical protein
MTHLISDKIFTTGKFKFSISLIKRLRKEKSQPHACDIKFKLLIHMKIWRRGLAVDVKKMMMA